MSLHDYDPATLPLSGRVLLEASAGTGKTTALVQIYLRLLLERELRPAQILAVSFTEASAAELAGRIRAAIVELAQAFERPTAADDTAPEADPWRVIKARHGAEPERVRRLLRLALDEFDQARIETFHGCARRLLDEFAFSIGRPLAPATLDSGLTRLRRWLTQYWRAIMLAPADPQRALLEVPLEACWLVLKALWPLGDLDWQPPPDPVAAEALRRARADLRAQRAELLALGARLDTDEFAVDKRSLPAFRYWFDRGLDLLERDELLPARSATEHRTDEKRYPPWPRQRKEARCALKDEPLLQRLGDHLAAVEKYRLDCLEVGYGAAWQHMRARARTEAERGLQLAFDDLFTLLLEALEGPGGADLAARIRGRYPAVLIDECQDSDARQLALVEGLFAADDQGLVVYVGDPKQAIYAFRGGDLPAYLSLRERVGTRLKLARHRRSDAALLEAIEAWFSAERAFVDPALAIDHLQADAPPRPPLTLDGVAVPPVGLYRASEEHTLDDWAAQDIAWVLAGARAGEERVVPGRCAVLVPDHHHALRMQQALRRVGVPSTGRSRTSVFETPAARQLAWFLDALSAPQAPSAAKTALVTTLGGAGPDDFERGLADPTRWEEIRRALCAIALERDGPLASLLPWVRRQAARSRAYGPSEHLNHLRHLLELAEAELPRGSGARELALWLRRRRTTATEADQVRAEDSGDRIQILTVHAAKGLEFDLVWIPFLAAIGTTKPPKAPVVAHQDGRRKVRFTQAIATTRSERADAEHDAPDALAEQAKFEQRAEGLRLLYVAVTRAKRALRLGYVPSKKAPAAFEWLLLGADAQAPRERADAALARWAAAGRIHLLSAPPAPTSVPAAEPAPVPVAAVLPRPVVDRKSLWSYSRLARLGEATAVLGGGYDEPSAPAVDAAEADPQLAALADFGGVGFGSAVHRLLERCLSEPGVDRADAVRDLARALGAPPAAAALRDLVDRALGRPLATGVVLAALEPSARCCEFDYVHPLAALEWRRLTTLAADAGIELRLPSDERGEGWLQGSIDLIYRHQGRYFVVDYKTNLLGLKRDDYRPARIEQAMTEHGYHLQWLMYLVALKRHLRQTLPEFDPERHLGGVHYLFLRGFGLEPGLGEYYLCPPPALIEAADRLLAGEGR